MQQFNKNRLIALERDEFTCQTCYKKTPVLDVHHIIPRRKQGLDSLNNLVTVCRRCHGLIELDMGPTYFRTAVRLTDEVYDRLSSLGEFKESYSDIIKKVLDYYESKQQGKKSKK